MSNNPVDWHGSFAVIVTPFTREGDVDEEGYRGVVDLVIEAGCHGVISAGRLVYPAGRTDLIVR